MPHPTFGPAEHRLASVELKLYLPTRRTNYVSRLEAHGRSETKRGSLWSLQELWEAEAPNYGLRTVDAAHHLLLAALQDRPTTQGAFEYSLFGDTSEQLKLQL